MYHEDDLEDEDDELDQREYFLYSADPDCEHEIELLWSGYRCTKCPGWYCA